MKITLFSRPKIPLPSWPSLPVLVPHRLRRRFRSARSRLRSRQSPTTSIASLKTSIRPEDTIRALRTHHWSVFDAQYLVLAVLGVFSLCVMQSPGPLVKTLIATLLMTGLIIPITRQVLLPALPVLTWLVFFYSCQFVPASYRPPISVRVLPALENIMYGANLSNILAAHKSTPLDILAWLPYGIFHYGAPFVVSALLFVFGPPGLLPVWAKSFGYMNLTGVIIQLFFPCSPPWYENMYGLAPANYSIHGSPAGLAAIDELFGIDLYTDAFTASPVAFGAFPSLHSGFATMEAFFMAHAFPKLRPLFVFYVCWLWWSTMYLSHHYAVDLVGGSLIAGVVFFITKRRWLPRIQPGKAFRWDYDYVEFGDPAEEEFAYRKSRYGEYEGLDLDEYYMSPVTKFGDSDAWTLASSSGSVSSASREPSAGLRSPAAESLDGDTLASCTDSEDYRKI